jgi:hypothetical protein
MPDQSDQLERDLERVLRAAGESAPRLDPGLLAGLDDRARRRRQTRLRTTLVCAGAMAVLAVVVLSSSVLRVPNAGSDPAATPSTTMVQAEQPKVVQPKPAEKLWPHAVHQIPGKLPDGREIHPVTFLDAETMLVATWSSDDRTDALHRYDLTTKKASKLVDVSSPGRASDITVSGGWIVWFTVESIEQTSYEIWGVPLEGGAARRLTTSPRGLIERLAVEGDKVYWSLENTDAPVYVAPIGGTATELPDSLGFHIVSWPWIGSPGPDGARMDAGIFYRNLRNVLTGEEKTTNDKVGTWSCHVTWCVGGAEVPMWAERRDGSERRQTQGFGRTPSATEVVTPVRDRFMVEHRDIFDLRTGQYGQLDHAGNESRLRGDDRLHYSYARNGRLEVIDLAAIE